MPYIKDILKEIEQFAPLSLQDSYDNAGVQAGNINAEATGMLICLDVTEAVVDEAIQLGCNLIVAHHPLIFKPLKSIRESNYIGRTIIKACRYGIVIYAAHTNLDNVAGGVSCKLASLLNLVNVRVLSPLANTSEQAGAGVIGELPQPESDIRFLQHIKNLFNVKCIRHSATTGRQISKVAVCGGSGAFLIPEAIACGADIFITGEAKYNDFIDVEDNMILAVTGHYESEICIKNIIYDVISKKMPTFAVQISNMDSNPIKYL